MAHTKYDPSFLLDDEFCDDTEYAVHVQFHNGQGVVLFPDFLPALRFREILLKGGVSQVFVEEQRNKVFSDEYLDEESAYHGF